MSTVSIPDLKRKLDLLMAFGPRKSWAALAVPFGRSQKTLRWWADGDDSRDPGTIPDKHLETMLSLVREALPAGNSDDDPRRLLFGDFRSFEQTMRAQHLAAISLPALIEKEGRFDRGRLHRAPDINLVERAGAKADVPVVALGQPFCLEFPCDDAGHALVLQHVQQTWAAVVLSDTNAIMRVRRGSYFVPARQADGAPTFMVEDRDVGQHRFVALITPKPYPADIVVAAQQASVFDLTTPNALAEHYLQQPKPQRSIDVVTLRIPPRET